MSNNTNSNNTNSNNFILGVSNSNRKVSKPSNSLINHLKNLENNLSNGNNYSQEIEQNSTSQRQNQSQNQNSYNIPKNKPQIKGFKMVVDNIINKLEKEVVDLNNKIKNFNSEKETIMTMSKIEINNLKSIIKKMYTLVQNIVQYIDLKKNNSVTKNTKIKMLENIRKSVQSNKGFLQTIDEIMSENGKIEVFEKNKNILTPNITMSNIINSSKNMGELFKNKPGIATVSNRIASNVLQGNQLFPKNNENIENSSITISNENMSANRTNNNMSANRTNGNMFSNQTNGNMSANRVNGNMYSNQTKGNMSANRTNENMSGNRVNGNMSANRINGNMSANRVNGNMSGNRTNGNMPGNRINGNMSGNRTNENMSLNTNINLSNNSKNLNNTNSSLQTIGNSERIKKYSQVVNRIHSKVLSQSNAKENLNKYFL